MSTTKRFFAVTVAALGMALPLAALAQSGQDLAKAGAAATPSLTDGEVRKVDLEAGKITIRHGEIKHLEMPGMTMVFTAREKSLLEKVKTGDLVRFMVVHEGGKFIVTEIQPAP